MEELSKKQEHTLLLYAMYTILYMNDTACFSIQQLGADVKTKDKESRKIYGALLKRGNHYLNYLSKTISTSMEGYCDYCTFMDELTDDLYEQYKQSIKKAYMEASIDDFDYCSKVETMRSMIELSIEASNQIINKISEYTKEVYWLKNYQLHDIFRVATNFSNWAYRKVPNGVKADLGEGSEVVKNFRKLNEELMNYDNFEKSYSKSVLLEIERKKQK